MDIKENLITFFKDNFMVEFDNNFNDTDSFLDNGIIDSTGVLELVTFLEEKFGIKVENDEIIPENLDSISNLEEFIKTKKN